MMQNVPAGLTVEEIKSYAAVEASKLKPKDPNNLQRSDLKRIETEIMEHFENVPNFDADCGELGLGAAVVSKSSWWKRQEAALTIKENNDVEEWAADRQQPMMTERT